MISRSEKHFFIELLRFPLRKSNFGMDQFLQKYDIKKKLTDEIQIYIKINFFIKLVKVLNEKVTAYRTV